MLIDFSIGNFRSIKDITTFSLLAASAIADDDHLIAQNNYPKILKSAALYGGNASGKSNLILAMDYMKHFVDRSNADNQPITIEPFLLDPTTAQAPTYFQINFITANKQYRYGFEIDKSAVQSEWLFVQEPNQPQTETKIFTRKLQQFEIAKDLISTDQTSPQSLFLSSLAHNHQPTAVLVTEWFHRYNVLEGAQDGKYLRFTAKKFLADPNFKTIFLNLLKVADLSIEKVNIKEVIRPGSPSNDIYFDIKTVHKVYNKNGERSGEVELDFNNNESAGTKKVFSLAGPISDTLAKGKILIIDELDSKLHPRLAEEIIRIFNSKTSNQNNAQLIFTTHNTRLLDNNFLRKDQIWFADKNQQGATSLRSLVEYKDSPDNFFEKDYYQGRFGGVPNIHNIHNVFRPKQK